ncbi:MAG: aldo/keto reductase [Tannerella sp.]|jgi:predicted oxidoreductase|nr:aldo/keto reductase [Tannerella sp.]
MKNIQISTTGLNASNIVLGCMRLKTLSKPEAEVLLRTALDEGINFFDHADVYGDGICETIFADALQMNASIREKLFLQSKCGIRKGFFDFSKGHILQSVDKILGRLGTDYLDVLLLHRPDALIEPAEVAEAFDVLQASGKVRRFGVSNFNPLQIELLQKYVPQKLSVNQLQLSIAHTPMIDSGLTVNMNIDQSVNREGSILDYCRLKDITIQAWSPFQKGFFGGPFLGDAEYADLNAVIDRIAAKYEVTNTAVAVGWLTRHPANMQVILGTTNPQRVIDSSKGSDLPLTREEWYDIYKAAGNIVP